MPDDTEAVFLHIDDCAYCGEETLVTVTEIGQKACRDCYLGE